jgi:hypothetical protein
MANIRYTCLAVALLTFAFVNPWLPKIVGPSHQLEASSVSDDNDIVRDGLRRTTLEAADQLSKDPCDTTAKARYIAAATEYAQAWLSIAPCVETQTCEWGDGPRLDRARRIFGSPLDHRVREAMQKAHRTGAVSRGDFPKGAVTMVAEMAADPVINPLAARKMRELSQDTRSPPSCRTASLR